MNRLLCAALIALALAGCHRRAAMPAGLDRPAAGSPVATGARSSPITREAAAAADAAAEARVEPAIDNRDEEPGTTSLERIADLPRDQQLPEGRWKPGVNYDAIVPEQPTTTPPGKVEVLEVFWLGCPHCYAFEPYLRDWLKKKPAYVSFVRVPVMWGPVHRVHAQLFYTLEELGRDDLVEKAFDTIQSSDSLFRITADHRLDEAQTLAAEAAWAKSNGVDPDAFRKTYASSAVAADLQHAQEITLHYQVEGVPFIAVGGKYQSDVGKAGGHTELIELIDSLAASIHDHEHGA